MAYRTMDAEDLYEFYRRSLKGQSARKIGEETGTDHKTVKRYLLLMDQAGLTKDNPVLGRQQGLAICLKLLPLREKKKNAMDQLYPHEEYIRSLIFHKSEPMKPKTAYLVIKEKFRITASYETFKRFAQRCNIKREQPRQILRIELPPGREAQIDYGQVGKIFDPLTKKNRVVYAFVGKLTFSRMTYVKFVFTQKQVSFVQCIIEMLEFFGGVPEFISIDNLKSGVIKPDLYDPKLNKSLADAASYYGFFVNTCRVGTPTDKAKVERSVPVAREVFLRYKNTIENATIEELNVKALDWSRNEYGKNAHGTTHVPPLEAFLQLEKPVLRPLPDERYIVPQWKKVKVHVDQFIQFEKKTYSLPAVYRGMELWACKTDNILKVFYNYNLIREYVVTSKLMSVTNSDFPEDRLKMIDSGFPKLLIAKAARLCPQTGDYIKDVLMPHAFVNLRRAMGLMRVIENFSRHEKLAAVCEKARRANIVHPQKLKALFEYEAKQLEIEEVIPMSEEGMAMLRKTEYYVGGSEFEGEENGNKTSPGTESEAVATTGDSGKSIFAFEGG